MQAVRASTTPGRRGRPKAEDSREKIAHVLAVAQEEFSRLGYRAVTMRDIAEKADVSTRTLYNRYADKFSLFSACLGSIPASFPQITFTPGQDVAAVLTQYAIDLTRILSTDTSARLGVLVFREGGDFPELLALVESNQEHYLIRPLAAYLRDAGLADDGGRSAKLLIFMILYENMQRTNFCRPLQSGDEIVSHAAFVVNVFLGRTAQKRSAKSPKDRPKHR